MTAHDNPRYVNWRDVPGHWRNRVTQRALVIRWIVHHIFRYGHETCLRCGLPVGLGTASYWHTEDDLWLTINEQDAGCLCPRCFTIKAREKGIFVSWRAVA